MPQLLIEHGLLLGADDFMHHFQLLETLDQLLIVFEQALDHGSLRMIAHHFYLTTEPGLQIHGRRHGNAMFAKQFGQVTTITFQRNRSLAANVAQIQLAAGGIANQPDHSIQSALVI